MMEPSTADKPTAASPATARMAAAGLKELAVADVPSLEILVLDEIAGWIFSPDNPGAHYNGEHAGAIIEKLNVIDDGTTTVLEFNIVHANHPQNRTSAGVAAYEMGEDGLIKEARVYDEAW